MKKIAILGIEGMLGSAVFKIFNQSKFNVIGINRKMLDAQTAQVNEIKSVVGDCDYIINCIGIIKPYIRDDNPFEVERAIQINALFPHKLSQCGARVIQIATDCVYDGIEGNYCEKDKHNALDVYGKTKSLGEVSTENFLNLRCSIIGIEKENKLSLLEWFRNQPQNATVNGLKNHFWNGVTTFAFAKICKSIIENDAWFYDLQHIIPANEMNKANMLKIFAKVFSREDINIKEINAEESINRTLNTLNVSRSKQLWKLAGYNTIPTIEALITEIKEYE
ncbi:MAG: SDR family oxidoreductase [Spirochaetes bacterium]|nr:SDR family oxidoreductase [Spirochaetota bacterium]